MTEQTQEKKPRRKLLIMAVSIAVVLAIAIPLAVLAQTGHPDLEGFYFAEIPTRGYDLDGVAVIGEYRYVGLLIDDVSEAGVVTGYAWGFNATSVRGAKVRGGTSTYTATIDRWWNRQKLDYLDNTVNVTAEGTLGVYIPRWCVGQAFDGLEGVVEGSPVDLIEGWNSLNVTTAGDIDVWVWMDFEVDPFAEVFGLVGEGARPRFVLFVTNIVTDVDDTADDVLVGIETARVIAPGATYVVADQADGDLTIDMPYGTIGTVTAVGCTVDGESSVTLDEGENVLAILDEGESGGTLTIEVTTLFTIQWSGRVTGREGAYRLNGHFNWYDVADNVALSGKLSAKPTDLWWLM